ncbi:MAG: hypothetical protein HZB59_11840 [Ignavibacteriales bacterium]|nr:hypothetical protein [Ignavibacteriales bacterium]
MKIDWSFPRQIAIAIIIIFIIGGYPLFTMLDVVTIKAIFLGMALATLNVILGYAAIEYSIGKSMTTFFKYVIGGMGLRLVLLSILLVVLIKIFSLPVLALVGSMGFFYMIFLVLEILYIQRKIEIKQQN